MIGPMKSMLNRSFKIVVEFGVRFLYLLWTVKLDLWPNLLKVQG
jgi:hypothetical protein